MTAHLSRLVLAALLILVATGCTWRRPAEEPSEATEVLVSPGLVNESAMLPLLGYYHLLQRQSAAELARERQTLSALPATPAVQVRLAMLLGMPRAGADLPRAIALLDAVQRARAPEAASLHPLSHLLLFQYQERQRLEVAVERQVQQLKEVQRKRDELQEKIDALGNIERSIPVRPAPVKTVP